MGLNIVIYPDVDATKKLTFSLTNVSVREILHQLAKLASTGLSWSNDVAALGYPVAKPIHGKPGYAESPI